MHKWLLVALLLLLPAVARGDGMEPALHLRFEPGLEEGLTVRDALLQGVYQPALAPEHRGGVAGQALMFDGYSTCATLEGFALAGGELCVSVWVAPRTFSARGDGERTIVAQYQALKFARSGFSLGVGAFGQLTYRLALEEPSGKSAMYTLSLPLEEAPTLQAGVWNHVALVYDASAAEARVYLNGACACAQAFPQGSRFVPCVGAPLQIGDDDTAEKVHQLYSLGAFSGLMDEMTLYDRALTEEEIAALAAVAPQHQADIAYDRQRVAGDRYRPAYHVQGGQMWMNEFIAPFLYGGQYHLFFQTNLSGPYYRQASWGHMVSEDLIHWTDMPPALMAQSGEIDPDACFSGSAAMDADGTPRLFYTGVRLGGRILNRITSATPADERLATWRKSQTVLVEQPEDCSPTDFRDPFLYVEGDWAYMIVTSSTKGTAGATGAGEPLAVIYRAPKGQYASWQRLGTLLRGDSRRWPESGSCWECPVFFKLASDDGTISKYFLAVSTTGSNISVYYWLGTFDPQTGAFVPEDPRPARLDQGMLNLVGASTGFVDPQTGAALITSTFNDGRTQRERFDSGWSGFNTLWRALSLHDDGTLRITPMAGYTALHASETLCAEDWPLAEINAAAPTVEGGAHIRLRFAAGQDVSLLAGEPEGRHIRLRYDAKAARLTLDTTRACPAENGMAGISEAALAADSSGEIALEIFIDRCAVEVYANQRLCMTGVLLTNSAGPSRLWLSGEDGVTIRQMCVWRMP